MRPHLPLLILIASLAHTAHAQIFAVYATYSPLHASNVQTGSIQGTTGFTNQYTSFWTSGIGGGVTLGVLPIGPVRIGLDLRGSTKPGTVGADTAFAGVKVAFKAPLIPIKPYIQASGGYVATRTFNVSTTTSALGTTVNSGGTFTNQYAAYEILGGIDYHLFPFVDLRMIEIGAGKGYNSGISLGTLNLNQNLTIFTVNTGVVAHF